jgi:beta-N-acetylhexosaminidase
MSDDLSMKALDGPLSVRARLSLFAGCDLALHCNGDLTEMRDAAAGSAPLEGRARERFDAAIKITKATRPFDSAAAQVQLAKVLAFAAGRAESV